MLDELDDGGDDDDGEHDEEAVEFGEICGWVFRSGKRPGFSCLFEVTIDVRVAYDGSFSILSTALVGSLLLIYKKTN